MCISFGVVYSEWYTVSRRIYGGVESIGISMYGLFLKGIGIFGPKLKGIGIFGN